MSLHVVHQLLDRSLHIYIDYGLLHLADQNSRPMAGVTGQQGEVASPRYLTPSLVFPGVGVYLALLEFKRLITVHLFMFFINYFRKMK